MHENEEEKAENIFRCYITISLTLFLVGRKLGVIYNRYIYMCV